MSDLLTKYKKYLKMNLDIDMTRGKPSKEQLDLSMPMLDILNSGSDLTDSQGIDCRNYGKLDGLEECKQLIASLANVGSKNVMVFGNSSLNIMYECVSNSFLYGVCGSVPWNRLDKIIWLCPVPGYDRHFAICEHLGIQMINVPMKHDGPDMELIESLIQNPNVKGVWCVPMYSNPTGITYSKEVVERFAKLKPAAADFRIYWDEAYTIHHLYDNQEDSIPEILSLSAKYNNQDLIYKFVSTSKISFPGSGVAAIIASDKNLSDIEKHQKIKTVGYDKVNQLRHVRFFKDLNGIKAQMKRHAAILRPKFELVENILKKEVNELASWTRPRGGYFISLYIENKADKVIKRCAECGVKISDVGCAFPYHHDPNNSHIRIAPSFLTTKELEIAISLLCLAIKIECE